jgi:hypothetical protein
MTTVAAKATPRTVRLFTTVKPPLRGAPDAEPGA